jgi:hypothetical protein
MTFQLQHSEFPYIWGKLDFLFYQCRGPTNGNTLFGSQGFGSQSEEGVSQGTGLLKEGLDRGGGEVEKTDNSREYWTIYRGPGFLAVVKVCLPEARPAMQRRTEKERQLSIGKEGGRARSQIIPPQESLVLYKSFNAPWKDRCRQMADQ